MTTHILCMSIYCINIYIFYTYVMYNIHIYIHIHHSHLQFSACLPRSSSTCDLKSKAPWRQWTARKEAGSVSMKELAALISLTAKLGVKGWTALKAALAKQRLIECHVKWPLRLITLSSTGWAFLNDYSITVKNPSVISSPTRNRAWRKHLHSLQMRLGSEDRNGPRHSI